MGGVRSLMGIVGLVRRKRRLTMSWSGRSVGAALLRMLAREVFFSNNTQDENNNLGLSVLRMRAKRHSLGCI